MGQRRSTIRRNVQSGGGEKKVRRAVKTREAPSKPNLGSKRNRYQTFASDVLQGTISRGVCAEHLTPSAHSPEVNITPTDPSLHCTVNNEIYCIIAGLCPVLALSKK